MPKIKKLSPKMKGFAKDFVEIGNGTEAVMQNYQCKTRASAGALAAKNLQKPLVKKEIERLMEEKDMTDDFMIDRLKEGMDAKVVIQHQGDVEETNIPDHNTAFKWWDAAAKIKDLYPAQKLETKNITIDLELERMSKEDISKMLKELLTNINQTDG